MGRGNCGGHLFAGAFSVASDINLIQTNSREKKDGISSCHKEGGWLQAWLEQGVQLMLLRLSIFLLNVPLTLSPS